MANLVVDSFDDDNWTLLEDHTPETDQGTGWDNLVGTWRITDYVDSAGEVRGTSVSSGPHYQLTVIDAGRSAQGANEGIKITIDQHVNNSSHDSSISWGGNSGGTQLMCVLIVNDSELALVYQFESGYTYLDLTADVPWLYQSYGEIVITVDDDVLTLEYESTTYFDEVDYTTSGDYVSVTNGDYFGLQAINSQARFNDLTIEEYGAAGGISVPVAYHQLQEQGIG